MLDRIAVKPIPEKKIPAKEMRSLTASVKPSTYAFMQAEAEARNMPVGALAREIFERLESGEF